MKKKHIIFALCTLTTGLLSSLVMGANEGIIESTEVNNKTLESIDVKKLNSENNNSTFKTSKIYKQVDSTGTYLRFATAIKGNVNSIKYTRTIDGKEEEHTKDFEVSTLYKGIASGENISYFNGRNLFDEKITGTDDYYWACYTIKFTNETYKNSNINVTLNINGNDVTSTSTSLFNTINYQEDTLPLSKILKDNMYGLSYNIASYSNLSGTCIQDAIVVGDNVYYTISGANGLSGSLVKAKFGENGLEIEKTINSVTFATGTAWCSSEVLGSIFFFNNYLYLMKIDATNKNASYTTYDLELNEVSDNAVLPISLEGSNLTDLYYNSSNGMYVTSSNSDITIAISTTITLFDKDKISKSQFSVDSSNSCKYQSMFADDEFIYLVFGANETNYAEIKVYNYDGESVKTHLIKGENMVLNSNTGVQAVTYYNNNLYVFARDWNPANSYVFKANIQNIASSMTLAENFDLTTKKGQEQTLTIDDPIFVDGTKGTNVQSVLTDEKHVYYGITTNANNTFKLLRMNLENNKIESSNGIATTSTNTDHYTYQNAGNICLVGGVIYVTTIDLGLKALSTNTLEEIECTLKFKDAPSGEITALTYNEEENLFAVTFANNNKIYFYDINGNFVKVTSNDINKNGLDLQSLSASGAYLYAISGKDKTFAVSFDIFDWNGNYIGNKYINTNSDDYSGTKLGLSSSSNVQSILDINGRSYILVLQWDSSVAGAGDTGGYLYPVEL